VVKLDSRLERDDSTERQVRTELETRTRLAGPSGEAMEDGVRRSSLGSEDVERVAPRVAGVDHQWQLAFMGELDLRSERNALLGAWRVIVVVVQAALADRDHVGVVEKRDDG